MTIAMRVQLQPGMSVQTHIAGHWRVACCVLCGWASEPMTFEQARDLATTPGTHTCWPELPRQRRS